MTLAEFGNRIFFDVDENSVNKVNQTFNSIKSTATKLLGGIGIGLSLSSLNAIAEEFNGINDRVNAIVDSEHDVKEVEEDILEAANRCKVSYSSMASDVESLVNANESLFPIEDAELFVEDVNKLGKSVGYTDGEISSMQSSLQRIMSSGAASTSDISRMLRSTPALAKQLAESLGVATDELSEMAAQGELTAEVIKDSILGATDDINRSFDSLNYSISDAMLNIRNQWGFWVDDINSTLEISQTVAKTLVKAFDSMMGVLKSVSAGLSNMNDALGGGNNLFKLLATVAGAFVAALALPSLITGAHSLFSVLKAIGNLLTPRNMGILALIAAVVALALIVEDFVNFMQGNDSMIGYCFEQAGIDCEEMRQRIVDIWENLKSFFSGIWESIKGIFQEPLDWIKQKIEDVFGDDSIFAGIGEGLEGVIEAFDRVTKSLADNTGLQDAIGKVIVGFLGIVTAGTLIKNIISPIQQIGEGVSKAQKAISGVNSNSNLTSSKKTVNGITQFFEGFANMSTTSLIKGMANITIVVAVLTALAAAVMAVAPSMAELTDAGSFIAAIAAIASVGAVAMALTEFANIAGKMPISTVLLGLANMAIALTAVGAMAAVVMVVAGPVSSLATAGELAEFLLVVTGVAAIGTVLTLLASVLGMIPFAIVISGLADMAIAIGGFTAIAAAFGALSNIPGFNELVSGGLDTLADLSEGLGRVVGSLIGGIGEGVASSLPSIGESLAEFGENIAPFFESVSGVDTSGIADFLGALSAFVLAFTANDIVSFFTGGTDLGNIGTQLSDFADGAEDFFNTVAGMPEEGFTKATELFESISGMGNVMKTGGVAQFFTGTSDYSVIADALEQLTSDGVQNFYSMVAALPEDTFTKATSLFESLSGMGNVMKTGGVAQFFTGSSDYSKITQALEQLSSGGVQEFYSMVASLPEDTFTKATALFESLSGMGNVMKSGGLAQLFGGSSDYSKVAESLQSLASEGVREFYAMVADLPTDTFSKASQLIDSLANIGDIMKSGGLAQLFSGSSDYSQLTVFADTVVDFFDKAGTIDASTLDSIINRLQGFCDEVRKAVEDRFNDVPDTFAGIGNNIMLGLARGIEQGTSTVTNAIVKAVDQAVQAGKDAAGVASPSTRFRDEIGEYLPEGLAVGVEENTDSAVSAVSGMVDSILGQEDNIKSRLMNAFGGIEIMANANMVSPATAMTTIGGATDNSRNISQNVNINNTFNGDKAIQQKASSAMEQSADDITTTLARGLAYAG